MMMAGSLAGLFQITFTYPLDMIRTRVSLAEGMREGTKYTGIFDCIKKVMRSEGPTAFYKGIVPTWLSGTPYVAMQMTFYEVFKKGFKVDDPSSSVVTNTVKKLGAGAFAGLVAQTISYPGDTLRRRMQTNGIGGAPRIYENTWDCTKKIVKYEGFRGLFKGLSANVVRCIPGAAIQFWAYDTFKKLLKVS